MVSTAHVTGNMQDMVAPKFLTLEDCAHALGLTYRTVRNYHQVAERRRRDGGIRPGDFPPPDMRYGRSPVWKASTIKRWAANRPGRGAGGGRPRKAVAAR